MEKLDLSPFLGFSLLEIVLALAILAGALAALGEVMRLGDQNAEAAGDETQAELLAESVMSELVVGARPLENVNGAELAARVRTAMGVLDRGGVDRILRSSSRSA